MKFHTLAVLLVVGMLFSMAATAAAATNSTATTTIKPKNSAVSLYATSFLHIIPMVLGYRLLN